MEKTNRIGRWALMLLTAALLPLQAQADNMTNSTLSIETFTIGAGETAEMLIDLDNPGQEVTMVEFYMYLPTGLSVAEEDGELAIDIAGRTTLKKHSIETRQTSSGVIHVLLYSGKNTLISGTGGALLSVTLTASSTFGGGDIQLRKQLMTSPDAAKTESKPADYTYTVRVDTPAPSDAVTLTVGNYSREYGEANPTFGFTVSSGTVTSGTPTVSCAATKTSPVGTYPIVIAKGSVTNEDVTLVNGTLTITKAPLTVKAGNYTKTEGEANPAFAPTYSGFKNNETEAVLTKKPTLTTTATAASPVGTYAVTASGAEAQNYEISYEAGTLTVVEKEDDDPDGIIVFADAKAKAICIANWDADGDGELSKSEARAVTDIGELFSKSEITSFDELQFFTGLTAIPQSAFNGCGSLKSVRLPRNITSIGNYVFCYCRQLTSITIPASVKSIGAYLFEYCNSLEEMVVEEGNTTFDSRNGCNAIIQTNYGQLAFGCKNTVIPEGVRSIAYDAFYGIESLTSVNIPASVRTVGSMAFGHCKSLERITVSAGNETFDSRNGCNAVIRKADNVLVLGCRTTVIPSDVVEIGSYAFDGKAAGDMRIPGNVKRLASFALNMCAELTSVVMEEGVEEIGENAFQSCDALKSVTLPSTIKTIAGRAFANDYLKTVVSKIATPTALDGNALNWSYRTATLYVPLGKKSAYQSTEGWKEFQNIVEILPGDVNGDGIVDHADVTAIASHITGRTPEGFAALLADVNDDGTVNVADVVKVLTTILSKTSR